MSNQFVSVVIPVYNMDVELFNRAINSIKFNCEIIVVNDGSDKKYRYTCPGAKFINLEHNVGHLHARRIGVENATGDYIVFLDADDEFNSEFDPDEFSLAGDNMCIFIPEKRYYDDYPCHELDALKLFIEDSSECPIEPYVTNIIWDAQFLKKVMSQFIDYPHVRLGEDHLILIKALSMTDKYYYAVNYNYYIRHEPHTCIKLPSTASEDEIRNVWNEGKALRDAIDIMKKDIKAEGITDSDWDKLAFRLSTCKLSNVSTDLISKVTGKQVYKIGIPVTKITVDTVRKCRELTTKYFKSCTTLCDLCYNYDEDDHKCRYNNDMIEASVSPDECESYFDERYNGYLKDYYDEDGDPDLDKLLNSDKVTRFDKWLESQK